MINHGMEYNSQREDLVIAEYGRNVQNLINYTKTIEDQEKKQFFAEAIVNLMRQMNPAQTNDADYLEKLWRHLFRIADYDLDVTPQSGVIPTPESSEYTPSIIEYPVNQRDYRHYGHHVKLLIKEAAQEEDAEKRDAFALVIATYMKMAYRTWSRDHYVNDEIIKNDLKTMSEGKLQLGDEVIIATTAPPPPQQKPRKQGGSSRSKKGGYSRNASKSSSRRRR